MVAALLRPCAPLATRVAAPEPLRGARGAACFSGRSVVPAVGKAIAPSGRANLVIADSSSLGNKFARAYRIFFPPKASESSEASPSSSPRADAKGRLLATLSADRVGVSPADLSLIGERVRGVMEKFLDIEDLPEASETAVARWDPDYAAPVYRASFRVMRVKERGEFEFGAPDGRAAGADSDEGSMVGGNEAFFYDAPTYSELRAAERARASRGLAAAAAAAAAPASPDAGAGEDTALGHAGAAGSSCGADCTEAEREEELHM